MSTITTPIRHKRGDTFQPACEVTENGAPVDITGWTIASQLRTSADVLVAQLVVTERDDAAGTFVLSGDGREGTWPVGRVHWDIQYTDGSGVVRSTETMLLDIVADVTRGAV